MAMAPDEVESLNKALSGHGIEEKTLISVLGKWKPQNQKQQQRQQSLKKTSRDIIFVEGDDDGREEEDKGPPVQKLLQEFLRFKDAVMMWTMDPWERDARMVKEAVHKAAGVGGHDYSGLMIEISCTRSSDDLLGARRAYHSLFEHSIEEDIAFHIRPQGFQTRLLVGLVSSYRYEGPRVREEIAKSEAKMIHNAIKEAAAAAAADHEHHHSLEEEALRILTTRSKLHLKSLYHHYKQISGKHLDEDLRGNNTLLRQAVQCLCLPQTYFTEILEGSLRMSADERGKEAVTRVIVTRADVDLNLIKEDYLRKCGVSLPNKIQEVTNGNYRDFLLTLTARGES